ncbi:hypothetical protein BDV93DRAFT_518550 [Ceratobasidium sp. AG-I]|nr:hypothetical protein BDV93DRAFT_518550 [Ceratobasidium sp. AG-I]
MSDHSRRAIPLSAQYESKVNTLIAQSRRENALHRSRRHIPTPTSSLTPLALTHQLRIYPRTRAAGPPPPRSWAYPATPSPTSNSTSVRITPAPEWRARALRWILLHLELPGLIPHAVLEGDVVGVGERSSIPTLREMCVRVLIAPTPNLEEEQPTIDRILDPNLPAHIRRFIVRYSAIHDPLPWTTLAELWGVAYGEQGADGELIFVGKGAGGSTVSSASIREVLTPAEVDDFQSQEENEEDLAWDADEYAPPPPLTTLISLAHPLSKHLSFFPPTITHLALIATPLDLDTPPRALMSKLSGTLHLLEALDLSCNSWLAVDTLEVVDWPRRWSRLRAIAFMNCNNLSDRDAVTKTINSKRNWEKVIHIDFA